MNTFAKYTLPYIIICLIINVMDLIDDEEDKYFKHFPYALYVTEVMFQQSHKTLGTFAQVAKVVFGKASQ